MFCCGIFFFSCTLRVGGCSFCLSCCLLSFEPPPFLGEIAHAMRIDVDDVIQYNLAWIGRLSSNSHLIGDTLIRIPQLPRREVVRADAAGGRGAPLAVASASAAVASVAAAALVAAPRSGATGWYAGGRGRKRGKSKKRPRTAVRAAAAASSEQDTERGVRVSVNVGGVCVIVRRPAHAEPLHPADPAPVGTVLWVSYAQKWYLARIAAERVTESGDREHQFEWLVDGTDERWCVASLELPTVHSWRASASASASAARRAHHRAAHALTPSLPPSLSHPPRLLAFRYGPAEFRSRLCAPLPTRGVTGLVEK